MALKDLHDFPALQVPDVHLVIFASRHDPFASRHTEASGDAIFGIRVADVGLEAARGLIIPQTDGTVVRRGQNVFGVRRELDVLALVGSQLRGLDGRSKVTDHMISWPSASVLRH